MGGILLLSLWDLLGSSLGGMGYPSVPLHKPLDRLSLWRLSPPLQLPSPCIISQLRAASLPVLSRFPRCLPLLRSRSIPILMEAAWLCETP